jgi:flagellar motor switch/type III secretory pathway protein FliN
LRAERAAGEARRRLGGALAVGPIASALGRLLAADAQIVLRELRAATAVPAGGSEVSLALADGSLQVVLRPEPELAAAVVARVLGRVAPLAVPGAPVAAELRGALAAVALEVARAAGGALAWHVLDGAAPMAPALRLQASLLLDGRAFALAVDVSLAETAARADAPEPELRVLGDVEVALGLVVALSTAGRAELERLRTGDAWMPGDGWWLRPDLCGRGALAAASAEHGVRVDLAEGGQIVLRGDSVRLAAEVDVAEANESLSEAVLDAPIVVRVELGQVSMPAREWAKLRPGDVIAAGRRVAEPVLLRIAGREVARGDLVSIEGELGVRIREIVDGGTRE